MFAVSSVVRGRTVTTILTLAYSRTRLLVFTWRRITYIERYNNARAITHYTVDQYYFSWIVLQSSSA